MKKENVEAYGNKQDGRERGESIEEKRCTGDSVNQDDQWHDISGFDNGIPDWLRLQRNRRRLPAREIHPNEDDEQYAKQSLKYILRLHH